MIKIISNARARTRIAVAIPCLIKDRHLLEKYCLPSLQRLDPSPTLIAIDFNNGDPGGLKAIKTRLYDHVFKNYDIDIILGSDSDFYFFDRKTLNRADPDRLVNLGCVNFYPVSSIFKVVLRHIVKDAWSGCYLMPFKTWKTIRKDPVWDGSDSSIHRIVSKKYVIIRKPVFLLTRRSMKQARINALYHPLFKDHGLISRMSKIAVTIPA